MSNKIEIKNGTSVSVVAPQQSTTNISVPKQSTTNVTISGVKSSGVSDKTYVFTEDSAMISWAVEHNLNKKPSVSIVDSGDNLIVAEVVYVDNNNLTINFGFPTSGKAYLN